MPSSVLVVLVVEVILNLSTAYWLFRFSELKFGTQSLGESDASPLMVKKQGVRVWKGLILLVFTFGWSIMTGILLATNDVTFWSLWRG